MKKIVSLILALTLMCLTLTALTACGEKLGTGASSYLDTRKTEGRDIKYVEICVKDYGKMIVLLDATTAPVTVANFIKLANEGFYDGLTFHRIIDGFMIQGGDPKGDGSGGSPNTIKGEFLTNGHINDISHLKGVISMARGGDDMNSASSQFFICNADATSLDGSYASFGYVVEGLSVVDEITRDVLASCEKALGQNYGLWLYYGNGSLTEMEGYWSLSDLQPTIKYVRVLDSWEKP